MQQLITGLLLVVEIQLNMLRGILLPIIRSLSNAAAASGLPLERGGSSVVGRGQSGPITTNRTAITTFLQ